jgi:hypothetical protein
MVYIQKHAEELFWLQRRYTFIRMLDELLNEDASVDKALEAEEQFSKVKNPNDLVDRLREIYGDHIK